MKVVLTRDVKDMGRANEVVETSDGHALNFLIPKKMAIVATPAAVKAAQTRKKAVVDRKELDVKLVSERVASLADETITIVKKANEQGHLYDAVDAAEIAEAAKLPEEVIRIEKPFKELGTFDIAVSVGEQFGKFSISIIAE